jgi:hypothetical protein
MKLQSDFALLDVKRGRRQLDKLVDRNGKTGAEKHDLPERIPVVIHGWITHRHGRDDGVSQEYGVEVDRVEVVD